MDSAAKILDRAVALDRVGGDPKLLREIASLFLANYSQWLADLKQAAARGDALGVEHAAHGLKGSVANFGAEASVQAAFAIEQMGRKRDLAEVEKALNTLELALAALRPKLEAL